MGSDLYLAEPEAQRRRAAEVYKAFRAAMKLKPHVESLMYENMDSADLDECEPFFEALDEVMKIIDRPLFT